LNKHFTYKLALSIFLLATTSSIGNLFAQVQPTQVKKDSAIVKLPLTYTETNNFRLRHGIFDADPKDLVRTIEYDPLTGSYVLYERVGNLLYRPPQRLTFQEYLELSQRINKRTYFTQLASNYAYQSQQPGFMLQTKIQSEAFNQIFGGTNVDLRPQGSAEAIMAGQINKSQNPLFNTQQQNQFNFNFDQKIQLNLTGDIGTKLKITGNYNTDSQFQFENQVKLDYTGTPDEIIQKIEIGTVSMPLPTTLITGTQSLFGLKTKLKFGKLDVTTILAQQRSKSQTITISNTGQQGVFKVSASAYEANKHYFLSQYFHDNYNNALANIPIISSNVNITKIEVWVTNRTNVTTGSRDILAFMDLGENKPYNSTLVRGGSGFSALPAGFEGPGFTQQSNSLLRNLPANARLSNDPQNTISNYFNGSQGGADNYAKLKYARQLTTKEYTLQPQLGYISLNTPLNNDEVLAVAYQYTYNGVAYQVGEFSSDIPVNPSTSKVLYVKLLKNQLVKTSLPTWNLMMKNIYSLNASQISSNNFKLSISRLDDQSGIPKSIMEEGSSNIKSKLWLQLVGLDNLDQQQQKQPDGYFDFLEGVTINSQYGRIVFPVLEPFGKDLSNQFTNADQNLTSRYIFQQLYDSTQTVAQRLFPNLNRYTIQGTFSSSGGSEFQLNAVNIPQGSVTVNAGTLPLKDGVDYTINYSSGTIRILNTAILLSGQPISVNVENNTLFGVQQKTLFGSRFDYQMSDDLKLGATLMHLTEQPVTQNEVIGNSSISNTLYGFDANYNTDSRFLTKMVDALPFIHTKVPSSLSFTGEFAQLLPGNPTTTNFAGAKNGTVYLDDFENSTSIIDVKSPVGWQISSTPQSFKEASNFNDLSYGYNRARLAWYTIDPIFYSGSSIPINTNELSNHYVRQVLQNEVFPTQQSQTGQPYIIPTLDLAYYPMIRGPYNYDTQNINPDGTLQNPASRWGGIFKSLNSNDFEALNVVYIEFWMLDPFIYKPNSKGGDLKINLGNVSEDILKDGQKSLENALPVNGDTSQVVQTVWGKVSNVQTVVNSFADDPTTRALQDVGLDGLNDAGEQTKFAPIIKQVQGKLNPDAANVFKSDPSSDDYQYYQGPALDRVNAGILQRYSMYNGTEGNSPTTQQSQALLGLTTSAATPSPDGEDVNHDNNMDQDEEYFEYKVHLSPDSLFVGNKYITNKITSSVKLANGNTQAVTWYQFRIPINSPDARIGNIQDFKSIRYMRMYLTNFQDTTVLRMATLQLVEGSWIGFNLQNTPAYVIADPSFKTNPPPDKSNLDVAAVNIFDDANRTPIPYVVPPGIQQQTNVSSLQANTKLNEQSLSVAVTNLGDGFSRAAYKLLNKDLRQYKNLNLFIHAESNPADGTTLKNNDLNAFIRLGTDYTDNYYEYELPLQVTQPGTSDPNAIWPAANELNLQLQTLVDAKLRRDTSHYGKLPWPLSMPFKYNNITIVGQPDLSQVSTIMLGIRNPLRTNATSSTDDGLSKSGVVWFDELRLTDFKEQDGWAATGRVNAKLADFANISIASSKSTAGFGALESTIDNRSMDNNSTYDITGTFELGKFFPAKAGVHIPLYVDVSHQVSAPEYNPATPDVLLSQSIDAAKTAQQRDSIRNATESITTRTSINLTNVHITNTDTKAKAKILSITNLNTSLAFTEYIHHDFTVQNDVERTYHVTFAYNYSDKANYSEPFTKIIKKNWLALVKSINYDLVPTRLNYSINFDRFYSENTLRNNDPSSIIAIPTTFNKTFNITRIYGLGWNLTKSLTMDIDATNLSTVDEPVGRLDGLKVDTLWRNILTLGRTTNYNHSLNFAYTVPLAKIPFLDWTTLVAHYTTHFTWQGQPLFAITDPQFDVGNTIQNSKQIQLNPSFNFTMLYNKFPVLKRALADKDNHNFWISLLTSLKTVSATYTQTKGTFIPGYLPQSTFGGQDFTYNSPGIGFLLGSQADLRAKAIANGWISTDTLQNQQYSTTYSEDLHLRGSIEPIKGLKIDLTAYKTQDHTYQSSIKSLDGTNNIQELNPITTGNYTISYMTIATSFSKISGIDNTSATYQKFLDNESAISQRLGKSNPNSSGSAVNGFADGYGPNSQNVLVPAFLAAYTGKSATTSSLNQFPSIPIPNWLMTYNGLSKLSLFSDVFESIDIKNGYKSSYNVNGYSTSLQFKQSNGAVSSRDANNDFLPFYQFSQISILEQFIPLFGIDARFKDGMTASLEFRKSRSLSLSISNTQLAQQNLNVYVFGWGYHARDFRFPFGWFSGSTNKKDINFKIDFSLQDSKTLIYQSGVPGAQISSGSQNIAVKPSIDYMISKVFNLNFFYDSTITKPYTSQTFVTASTTFGINIKMILQ
jgi:cell surface protein SprA